jgi:flagellar L-ring protein precursor FlgH
MKTLHYKILFVISLAIMVQSIAFAQQNTQRRFENARQRSIVSDYKAMGVGDAVKVLIVETTEAGNSAGTTESRSSGVSGGFGVGVDGSGVSGDVGINSANTFKGSGANTRKETIRSILTARVIEEDERGNYIIEGTRKTKVDGEDQVITLRGIIRPVDIRSDNSVYSYNIMDLELFVEGEGNASKMQKPGLFTKFFRMLF